MRPVNVVTCAAGPDSCRPFNHEPPDSKTSPRQIRPSAAPRCPIVLEHPSIARPPAEILRLADVERRPSGLENAPVEAVVRTIDQLGPREFASGCGQEINFRGAGIVARRPPRPAAAFEQQVSCPRRASACWAPGGAGKQRHLVSEQ